jgi:ATP-binding cassette, subfamily C, bacteriocin exporter
MKDHNPDHFLVKQFDQKDCGVACLLSVIRYYGGTDTLDNLRKISGTNITGTTLLGLYEASCKLGFDAEGRKEDIEYLVNDHCPVILHVVKENSLQHYVVCFGVIEKKGIPHFVIGDPEKGLCHAEANELKKIWQSGFCLTLKPNDRFKKEKNLRIYKRSWIKSLVKQDVPLLSIAVFMGIVIASLGLVMAIFSQRLIDDILPKKNVLRLNVGVALVLVLLIAKEVFSVLRQYLLLRQSKDFNTRITDFFYNKLLHLPKSFFDTRKIGELTARLTDTMRIQKVISQLAGNVIIDLLITIVSCVFIFYHSWKIGVICLAVIPVFFWIIFTYHKKIAEGQRSVMAGYAITEGNYISTLQGIEAIKNYNQQPLFSAQNNFFFKDYQHKVFSLGKIQIRLSFLANLSGLIFLTGILLFSANQVLNGHISLGELIAILSTCGYLFPGIANLALIAIPLNEARIAFDRMFEFTNIEAEGKSGKLLTTFQTLAVNDVSFRFAGRDLLWDHFSFSVSKGEVIAVIGENGCGKSTLTQILQKHYLHESGSITVNGDMPLNDISIESWRNSIAVVPQQIHIFNGTVLENIAFNDAATKTNEVLQFLNTYGFAPFIDKLPQSFMTMVGEEGVNLSGGQKQMIALARALYHKPQLLILDEATAAMDRESEQFVLDLLVKCKHDMAVIFITHRLHLLKSFCNRIYILGKGNSRISGAHEVLLQTKNLYSEYWNMLM